MSAQNVAESVVETAYPFIGDVAEIRRRVRRHLRDGAVVIDDSTEPETIMALLNEALATELTCVQRYRRHAMGATAMSEATRQEFLKHAEEEQSHADQIAARIVQLGGTPEMQPSGLKGAGSSDYDEEDALLDLLEEDLIAERIAIQNYEEIVRYIGEKDASTREMFQAILAVEREHAREIAQMRENLLHRERTAASGNVRADALQLAATVAS